MLRHSKLSLCILLNLFGLVCSIQSYRLPSVWSMKDENNEEINFYRLRSEVELIDSKKSFILEEWLSKSDQAYRLDIFESLSGQRNTLLSSKITNENFYYQPFKCSLIQNLRDSLSSELTDKFPPSDFVTGISSLWQHASSIESEYTEVRESSGMTASSILKNYSKYTIQASEDYPFKLELYFATDSFRSLSLIQISNQTDNKGPMRVRMRIRILEVDTTFDQTTMEDPDLNLFDLPLGYGCQHKPDFYNNSATAVETLNDIFEPDAVNSSPYIVNLNIISSLPINQVDDYEKWKTHTSSLRIAAGRFSLDKKGTNDYLVVEIQDYAPESQSPKMYGTQVRKATLRRLKQIWELGDGGLSSSKADWDPAMYFEINEQTGECLGHGESLLGQRISIEFATSAQKFVFQEDDQNPPVAGLTLNTETLRSLFSSTDGFHLIRESESLNPKELIYELRLNSFEMRNKKGFVIWSGPVSFIRRHLIPRKIRPGFSKEQVSVTMNFLTKSLDRLVSKIHLVLGEKRFIDQAYFHEELDLSVCYEKLRMEDSNDSRRKKSNTNNKIDFTLNYPLESQEAALGLSQNDHAEPMIYEQFLSSLLKASSNRLDLLQVVDIDIDFGLEMLKVSCKLLEKPSLLNYRRHKGQKFSDSKRGLLFIEFKDNEEACAESCANYHCTVFAYCLHTKTCDLVLRDKKKVDQLMSYDIDPYCSLYTPRKTNQSERQMKPLQLVHDLRQLILAQSDDESPLAIKVGYFDDDDKFEEVILVPTSIESGLFKKNSAEHLIEEVEDESGDTEKELSQSLAAVKIQVERRDYRNYVEPEYVQILADRKYINPDNENENFPLKVANHLCYEDCELLCTEVDCRSFSHCYLEKTCLISSLHQTSLIEKYSEKEAYCSIIVRDDLSKFSRTIQVARPTMMSKSLIVESDRECAINCMNEQEIRCRSFYYCESKDEKQKGGDCYLRKSHVSSEQETPLIDGHPDISCDFHSRSFLVEFDKFYGKSLPNYVDESVLIIKGIGAESCAAECYEQDGKCLAFHICRSESSFDPICALRQTERDLNNDKLNITAQLEDNLLCTAFVLSSMSELNFSQRKTFDSNDLDYLNKIELQLPEENQWLIRWSILVLGIIVGVGLAIAFKRFKS